MSQERFWNWRDDDSTFRLNWRDLLIIPYGLYLGFDGNLVAGLDLFLTHTITGKSKVKLDLTDSPEMGVWKSKQGVVVTEDSDITIKIAQGDNTFPRIDLIVAEHQYIQTPGGSTAVYKVIQGTPSNTPVAPALNAPNKQVILGRLKVPVGMTSLTDPGVEYIKETRPDWAGDNTIMHTNQVQTSTHLKVFNVQKGIAVVTEINQTTHKIQIPEPSNFYVIDELTTSYAQYEEVNGLDQYLEGAGQLVTFFTVTGIKLKNTFGSGGQLLVPEKEIYIEPNTCFSLLDISNTHSSQNVWVVVKGGEPSRTRNNKYHKSEIWSKHISAGGVLTIGSNTVLRLPTASSSGGNYFEVNGSFTTSPPDIQLMESLSKYTENPNSVTQEAGGIIFFKSNITMTLEHDDAAISGSAKPLWIPTLNGFEVTPGTICMLIEDTTHWRLLSVWNEDLSVITLAQPTALGDLSDVTLAWLGGSPVDGHVIMTDGGIWKNKHLQSEIENMNLKMNRTLENDSSIYTSIGTTPWVGMAGTGGIHYGLSLGAGNGNLIIFNYPPFGFVNTLDGLPASFQIGTEITMFWTAGIFSIRTNQFSATSAWLPLKRMSNTATHTFAPNPGRPIRFIRMSDHWLMVEYSVPQTIPTAADNFDYDSANAILKLRQGTTVLDSQYLYAGIRATSGFLQTNNRQGGGSQLNNFSANVAHVYPPSGYTIYDLSGFIPSIGVVYYNGDVDDNDTIWCRHQVQYSNNRIAVICNNSESRANAWVNYFALWRK